MTKRILDEKTRQELLGYAPFSSDCKILFTPEEYKNIKDENFRPVFDVRSLNQSELSQLKHNSREVTDRATVENITIIADKNLNVIRKCVLGWKNLFDVGTMEEIEFVADSSGGCDEKLFCQLPVWLQRGILEFVKKISGLSEPEELSIK